MKSLMKFIILCSFLFLQDVLSQNSTQQSGDVIRSDSRISQGSFVPGVLLVKFKDGVPAQSTTVNGLKKVGVTTVDALLEKYQAKAVGKLFPTAQPLAQKKLFKTHTGQTIEQPNLHNIYKIELADPTKLYKAIEAFKQDATVEFAEPNYIYSIVADKPVSGVLTEKEARKLSKPATTNRLSTITINDPLYSQQWYIPAVHADAVWDSTQGDTSQVIAFLDTGVDWHHPDLADNIWINTAEANGVAGVDDDGDGYIDDIRGWDFINNDNDPSDDNSHGTHVAGIACAEGNNGIGIAGVDWHARIMPVKVFQSNGQGDAATISQGINYASSKGATVINMSFGSYARSLTMEAALQSAYANCVLVAAAGNDGIKIGPGVFTAPFFPAALSYVLGVQATQQAINQSPGDKQGTYLSDFTNYDQDGPVYSGYPDLLNYEMKAPGSNIISTVPNGGYRVYSGTSMATPIVSGAVALYRQLHPTESQELMWGNLVNTSSSNMNLFDALNVHANPSLWFVSNIIVDTLAGDNGNGFVDASERIQLWFTVRNTWGSADSVFVGLRLGEFEDTSVAHILNPAVLLGSMGPYATRTNESNPFVIQIAPNTVQNRNIVFQSLCWSHGSSDTTTQSVLLNVQNGVELSDVMDSTLVLDASKQWLIHSSFRVGSHGVLIINPGTHIINTTGIVNRGVIMGTGKADSLISITGQGGISGSGSLQFAYTQFSGQNSSLGADRSCSFDHCVFSGISTYGALIPCAAFTSLNDNVFKNINSGLIFYNAYGGAGEVHLRRNNFVECAVISNLAWQWQGNIVVSSFSQFDYNNLIGLTEAPDWIGVDINGFGALFGSVDSTKTHNNFIGFGSHNHAFVACENAEVIDFPNQYWGSAKQSKFAKKVIYDFYSNASLPKVNLVPFLLLLSDSAHGLVWKVLIDGIDPQDSTLDPIGLGLHRFDVYFNRPMDTTFTPQLSFGVRLPFTQQAVTDSAHWSSDHRIWTAYKTVKLYTGDGNNTVSVAGAKDPEGFEIPVENMRFQFLIDAAGTSSLDFTATPGLGKINLEWNNTGLVDLLGFNMYRFTNKTDTTYTDTTLINTKLITDTLYTDFSVVPGKKYYYLYKVVRTDFSQSNYSHVAGATALTSSPGDANGDLAVDVLDIVTTVDFILGENPQPFIFAAADINKDSTINVLDVVGIVNIILHPQAKITLNKAATGSAHLDIVGSTISLTSDAPVTAIQFKMVGKGLKNIQFTPGAALSQFEVASNLFGDTTCIFLIYSMKGLTLPQGTNMLGTFAPAPTQAAIVNAIISDAQGHNILTNVFENGRSLIPTQYSLEQNFPNPFNLSTQIQYALPEKARVKIVIYNLLGQRVKTFDIGERAPGRYSITWNGVNERGTTISSGIYFYRFDSDKFTQTKKLVLIK